MSTLTLSYDPLHQIIQPVHNTAKAMALNFNEVAGVEVLSVATHAHREPRHARHG